MRNLVPLFFILAVLFPAPAWAWSPPGHRVVAAIAYRDLSAADKSAVTNLLSHHPNYHWWVTDYTNNHITFDFGTYAFMRASTWADDIRNSGSAYDHYNWHFVDFPLRPPSFPDDPRTDPTNDVIYAIAQCETSLTNRAGLAPDRAAHLALLVHYVGDIHQPLHCSSLFNADYPAGDRGGNDFFVKLSDGTPMKLHGLWDQGLGATNDLPKEFAAAVRISTANPRASYPQITAHTTPESWGREGRAIAKTTSYRNGQLAGGKTAATAVSLPAGYTNTLKAVAERQAPLAGYRLADEVHKYLVAVNYPPGTVDTLPVVAPVFDTNSLVAWELGSLRRTGSSPLPAGTNAAHVTCGGLVRGSGIASASINRGWGGSNFTGTNAAEAVSTGDCFTFTVTPDAGYSLSCSAIGRFDYRRSVTGPADGLLQFQVGTNAFTDLTNLTYSASTSAGGSIARVDLAHIAALQNTPPGTPVTFRIVNWNGTAKGGTWYLFDTAASPAADFSLLGTAHLLARPRSPGNLHVTTP